MRKPDDDAEKNEKELLSFEDCLDILDMELEKRRGKWRLTAIAWMDYEDVSQKIRLHVFNKWSQWDQSRPLKPWLNTIISNQITNMIRNNYSSFCKPCAKCEFNMGGEICSKFGKQSGNCPDFNKWEKTKRNAYEIKLPVSMSHESQGHEADFGNAPIQFDIPCAYQDIDYEQSLEKFTIKMKECLTPLEWKVYESLYIKNLTEIETAQIMGYKTSEKNRSPGYKQIKKVKNKIISISKNIVKDLF